MTEAVYIVKHSGNFIAIVIFMSTTISQAPFTELNNKPVISLPWVYLRVNDSEYNTLTVEVYIAKHNGNFIVLVIFMSTTICQAPFTLRTIPVIAL